ncbi:MAG TPA: hypothetical protein VE776_11265 [Actinomycetota bacterium]|nr:hypothetical protein [Actinomycetota bacterium]
MITQQRRAVGSGQPLSPTAEPRPAARPATTEEPAWLWESLRSRFWDPADLARGLRHAGGLQPEQRARAAEWWSLLMAADQLGPRLYAAAFVRATERHDSDQVRWSLVAMLRDELQHEQLFRQGMQGLLPGRRPWAGPRPAEQYLRRVDLEAERRWHGYQQALDRYGIAAVSGGLLLGALVTGDLYGRCASGCTIPAFATAFRHLGQDAKRHQGALRALAARDWPFLTAPERTEAAAQVQAAAGFLTTVLLDPAARPLGHPEPGDLVGRPAAAFREALGVPTEEERLEILRAALLKVRDLQRLHGIPFPAIPALAIPGTERDTGADRQGGGQHARV